MSEWSRSSSSSGILQRAILRTKALQWKWPGRLTELRFDDNLVRKISSLRLSRAR